VTVPTFAKLARKSKWKNKRRIETPKSIQLFNQMMNHSGVGEIEN
jgi:hypothetical protein